MDLAEVCGKRPRVVRRLPAGRRAGRQPRPRVWRLRGEDSRDRGFELQNKNMPNRKCPMLWILLHAVVRVIASFRSNSQKMSIDPTLGASDTRADLKPYFGLRLAHPAQIPITMHPMSSLRCPAEALDKACCKAPQPFTEVDTFYFEESNYVASFCVSMLHM